jgi:hypothetical protein
MPPATKKNRRPALLRRYTDLTSTIDILSRRRIVLLDPAKWDDQNDVHFIDAYKARTGAKSVLVLCMSSIGETYHHWRVFCGHSSGVCIEFFREDLVELIKAVPGVRSAQVKYMTLLKIEKTKPKPSAYPFIKRKAFQYEKEYRLIYASKDVAEQTHNIQIPLSVFHGIKLSPWLAPPLAEVTGELLRSIPGCDKLDITRSDLINNERFKRNAVILAAQAIGAAQGAENK